ncbi:Exonuclease 1 [Schistosoma japonicum]|nr:Exonuclease 1 [Schistosoma japonicum]
MGIKGLLPFLKNAAVPVNLADFSGYVAAVDVYCWIHRSSYSCASDLALGIPTDQYIRYVIKYINLMKSCNVKPILVFDGLDLPSKAETDLKRREAKELNRKKAAEHLMKGNKAAAQECFERSVFVTSEMAYEVLRAARNIGVDCIIAPYEADAQLAYLNRTGYADFVITEDSDLLLFGCRQVIFKLDLSGSGVLVAAASGICECCGIPASQFTESKFRFMGIMAGCDYFSGIPGIGLTTAAKILRQTRITNFRELLSKLGFYVKLSNHALAEDNTEVVKCKSANGKRQNIATASLNKSSQISESLINAAVRAERTFRLQVVFDISSRCQKRFSEPTPEDIDEELHSVNELEKSDGNKVDLFAYAGRVLKDNEKAFNLALGNINYSDGTTMDEYYPCTSRSNSMQPVQANGAIVGHSSIHTKLQSSDLRPNLERLKISIWDKNYPLQKFWLRRSQSGRIEPISNFLSIGFDSSIEKENKNPVEKSPMKTLDLKGTQSTCGRRILVPTAIQQSLKSLRNCLSLPHVELQDSAKRLCLRLSNSSVDDTCNVLQVYGQNNEVPTTPNLKDRSHLSSSIVSASCYFTTEDKTDEVITAVDFITNPRIDDDDYGRSQTSRSPVFYKANSNPFRIASESCSYKSKEKVNDNLNISPELSNEYKDYASITSSDKQSVCRFSFDSKCFQYKKSYQQPLFADSSSVESNKQLNSVDSPISDFSKSTTELQDSSSAESSPSFLNSHKFVSQIPSLPPNKEIDYCNHFAQNSNRISSVDNSHASYTALPKENTPSFKQDNILKLSTRDLKSKKPSQSKTAFGKNRVPVQSSNLDSFFQKWKFK